MQIRSAIIDTNKTLGYAGVVIPKKIVETFKRENSKRVKYTINNKIMVTGAFFNDKERGHYVLVNKTNRKNLNVKVGDIVTVKLEKDTSQYGIDISKEFQTVLEQDLEASKIFHSLTPGKQRSLIHLMVSLRLPTFGFKKLL